MNLHEAAVAFLGGFAAFRAQAPAKGLKRQFHMIRI